MKEQLVRLAHAIPFFGNPAIKRFAWVDPWLARGGQPQGQAFRQLERQGIRVVVNLRECDERKDVLRAGLESVHIPVKNDYAPSDEQVLQWLALCADKSSSSRMFVHCEGGEGRTSTFCAAVRLAQGYSVEAAIDEQRNFNFQPEGAHRRQGVFLRAFAKRVQNGEIVLPKLPGAVAPSP